MKSSDPSANLTNTLKIIAKYEELLHAHLIELDIPNHTMLVNREILPTKSKAMEKWRKEATMYFAFKGAGDFTYEKDTLFIKDKSSHKLLHQVVLDKVNNAIVDRPS